MTLDEARRIESQYRCRTPAYGIPGHEHCADCCNFTGYVTRDADEQAELDEALAILADPTP